MWVHWDHPLARKYDIYVKECGGSGDSQLFAILEALKHESDGSIHWLRERMVYAYDQWTDEAVEAQLVQYRYRYQKNKLGGIWTPLGMDRKDLREQLLKPNETGNPYDFEEDEFTLQLLGEALQVNIWVFSHNTESVWHTKTQFSQTICLLYHHLPHFQHYQLLGFPQSGPPQTLLTSKALPKVSFIEHLPSYLHIRSHYTVKPKRDLYLPKVLLKINQWYNVCFAS